MTTPIEFAKASLSGNYMEMYDAIWPHVKRLFESRIDTPATINAFFGLRAEIEMLHEYIFANALKNRDMMEVAFKSCVYAAERWYFTPEE